MYLNAGKALSFRLPDDVLILRTLSFSNVIQKLFELWFLNSSLCVLRYHKGRVINYPSSRFSIYGDYIST